MGKLSSTLELAQRSRWLFNVKKLLEPPLPANIKFNLQTSSVKSNTGGADDFTFSNFGTPKAVMNVLYYTNGINDIEASSGVNIGFADGTREGQVAMFSKHNLATPDAAHLVNDSNAIEIIDELSSVAIARAAMTNITDGCRYTWSSSGAPVDYGLANLMFGGSVLSAKVDNISLNIVDDGTHVVTGVGFKPDVLMIICSDSDLSPNAADHGPICYGFADASLNQGSLFYREFGGGANSFTDSKISDSFIGNMRIPPDDLDLELTSLDSDGFTLTARTPGVNWTPDICYLALKLAESTDAKVGAFDIPTSTGVQTITGIGFKPRLVIQVISVLSVYDVRAEQNSFFALSILTGSTQAAGSAESLHDSASSNTTSNIGDRAVEVANIGGASFFIEGSFAGFTLDGYKINYTVTPGTVVKGIYLAMR